MHYGTKIGCWLAICLALAACGGHAKRARPTGALIDVQALDSLLQASNDQPILIDVRPAADYEKGHIPGAINVWRPSLIDSNFVYQSITAPKAKLEAEFGRLGLRNDRNVVVYDGKMNTDAANLWWIFQLAGLHKVQLLQGGLEAWQSAGRTLETHPANLPPTDFHFPEAGDSAHYASLAHVQAALQDPNVVIVDTRTQEEYTGETVKDGAKKGGHIPGSVWLNYSDATEDENGCNYLKSQSELEAMFAAKGITKDKKIICYCHSGVRSAHTTFVLTQVLGYPSVRNFDGSWEEWSQVDSLPFETGIPSSPHSIQ
jgi:thiosulfate/3-mercaptopyruvate sulfurtransferase